MASLNLKTDSLASISTNETTLQPGFILFFAFVLFGLILSVILQKITAAEVPDKLIEAKSLRPAKDETCMNVPCAMLFFHFFAVDFFSTILV